MKRKAAGATATERPSKRLREYDDDNNVQMVVEQQRQLLKQSSFRFLELPGGKYNNVQGRPSG
jgi:hypothetical protein